MTATRRTPRRRRATEGLPTGAAGRLAAVTLAAVTLVPSAALASPAGDLDPSFDQDGRRVLVESRYAAEVLVQEDGKILVVADNDAGVFRVIRLNPDGSRDRAYGKDGVAEADFGGDDIPHAGALQPDGKLLVAGESRSPQSGSRPAVARFTTTGSLDPQFDPGGEDGDGRKVVVTPPTASQHDAKAVLVQRDGMIVLAGTGYSADKSEMAITRLNPGGSVDDTTFARGSFADAAIVTSAALTPSGQIVVAGSAAVGPGGRSSIAITRFGPEGELDKTLGGTGKVTFNEGLDEIVQAVLVQPDGKIVTVGAKTSANEPEMVLTRFDRDGQPDTAFDADGRTNAGFGGTSVAGAAALQPDGKIVVAGLSLPPGDVTVWRVQPNGAADPDFGSGGRTSIDFGGITGGTALALQGDGRPIVAGTAQSGALVPVARLLPDPPPSDEPAGPSGGGADPGPGPGTGGGDPGSDPGRPTIDRDAPALARVSLTRKTFSVSRRATPLAAAARGTTIRYTLSERAAVTVRVERIVTRRGRARRFVTAGTLRRSSLTGVNRVAFSGRIGRRALRPGAYRLVVSATDAAGNRSTPRSAGFRIVR